MWPTGKLHSVSITYMVCSKSVLKIQGSFAKNSGSVYLVDYLWENFGFGFL